ncbi:MULTISPECIES: hypothetical protein [Rhodobacterales]|uniref:hypothetical protein n=1 Tax=Rhodobacterales TaxID=204455 RepID=UPI0015F12387|nr:MULTISPECIES: hypothetical protein [Rhodobacterales]
MSQQKYMAYLQSKSKDRPNDPIEMRLYKNMAKADVMIHLPRSYWDFVEWVELRGDISFQDWVIHCEQTPFEDWSISELLMYWLWMDQCNRHRYGLPKPNDVLPEGYEPFGEVANDSTFL